MDIEIKITIKHKDSFCSDFNKEELISDLNWQFVDITGYEINSIEINEI